MSYREKLRENYIDEIDEIDETDAKKRTVEYINSYYSRYIENIFLPIKYIVLNIEHIYDAEEEIYHLIEASMGWINTDVVIRKWDIRSQTTIEKLTNPTTRDQRIENDRVRKIDGFEDIPSEYVSQDIFISECIYILKYSDVALGKDITRVEYEICKKAEIPIIDMDHPIFKCPEYKGRRDLSKEAEFYTSYISTIDNLSFKIKRLIWISIYNNAGRVRSEYTRIYSRLPKIVIEENNTKKWFRVKHKDKKRAIFTDWHLNSACAISQLCCILDQDLLALLSDEILVAANVPGVSDSSVIENRI